ncbi:MAG: biotin/lipoyl-binding protein [Thermoanaerobaculales bacterium]|nr:biotin/lipoyl-binding protein [Thermoanaerobaculales bacterium]
MKWTIRGASSAHEVEVERTARGFIVTLDGVQRVVDYRLLDGSVASLRYLDNGHSFHVTAKSQGRRHYRVAVGEREFDWRVLTPVEAVASEAVSNAKGAGRIVAPIPGKVVAIHVALGDEVEAGRPLVILEAMKMENELAAERAGRVAEIHFAPGDIVESGSVLIDLEEE